MKALNIFFLTISCLTNFVYAESQEYQSTIEQYGLHKDSVLGYSEGSIDGQYYLALVYLKEVNNSEIYLLTINSDKSNSAVKLSLQLDSPTGYSVNIKNNSFYIQSSVAHHGWYDRRFQFKKVSQEFRLVGIEDQSMVLGCYAGDELSSSCESYEVWSSNSYNLLTSKAICWKKTLTNDKNIKAASDRYEKWLQPKSGVRHQIEFSKMNLPMLDGFNFFEFDLPKSCYFDGKNKLIK